MTGTPYYSDESATLHHGDALAVLRELPDCSVDSVVTDPPYGLEFMGKDWDKFGVGKQPRIGSADGSKFRQNMGTPSYTDNGNPTCRNCGGDKYRNGPRKCTCSSPDFGNPQAASMRGFQQWCEQWATECLRVLKPGGHLLAFGGSRTWHRLQCAVEDAGFEIRDSIAWLYGSGFPKSLNLTDEAGERTGWGTALKPAFEPIVVGRKPLAGTVAANVLQHGTGALHIDATRVPPSDRAAYESKCASVVGLDSNRNGSAYGEWTGERQDSASPAGRWPTNVVMDESQAAELDRQTGDVRSAGNHPTTYSKSGGYGGSVGLGMQGPLYSDGGGASRFFPTFRYEAKAATSERPKGEDGTAHPTVKPLDLMRWLVRLVTPPGGTVLEPFAGSGTTIEACLHEGFRCTAIEREAAYLPLILQRITKPMQTGLDLGEVPA